MMIILPTFWTTGFVNLEHTKNPWPISKRTRRTSTADFNAKVALEAVGEAYTLSECAQKFEVSLVMISRWKSELLANVATLFQPKSKKKASRDVDVDIQICGFTSA